MADHRQLTLYSFVDFDRGSRVRWLCLELGITVTDRRLNFTKSEHKTPAFMRLNPFGLVPAVEYMGQSLWESGAICQYLVEQFPDSGLAPLPNSPERAEYLSWVFFSTSTFDAAAFEVFFASVLRPDEARKKLALERINPLLKVLEWHLHRCDYLLGERFRLPDLLVGHALTLLRDSKALSDYPYVVRYMDRLAARPAAFKCKLFATR